MTDYARWAEEYKNSAVATKAKINKLEIERQRCRDPGKLRALNGRLLILYEMYSDCMIACRELQRRSERIRED